MATDKANITPAPIKGAFTAADKPYDGNTNATITGRSVTSGIVGSENVTIEGGTANFLDPEPGLDKPVKGNGNFSLGGTDKSNYVLVEVADTTATIQRPPAPAPPVIDTTPQCLRRPVIAFVRGKRIKKVVFYLDGRKIDTVTKKDAKKRYSTLIQQKLLADGPHKLRAKVTFLDTKKVWWLGVRLKRCVGPGPAERDPDDGAGERQLPGERVPRLRQGRDDLERHVHAERQAAQDASASPTGRSATS